MWLVDLMPPGGHQVFEISPCKKVFDFTYIFSAFIDHCSIYFFLFGDCMNQEVL